MTSRRPKPRIAPRVHREAERWFVRLLDAGSQDSGRSEFEAWLTADPRHASAYRETERLWASSREAARHPDVVSAANHILAVPASPAHRPPRRRLVPAVAWAVLALVVMTGLGSVAWFSLGSTGTSYVTQVGQQRTLNLRDGSVVLLDTDSAVTVHYDHHTRRVDLLHGRAEFSVAHDPDKPFVVHAGGGTVTDVGTQFQVSIGSSDHVRVVLIRGEVAIVARHSNATLTQGEALGFDATGIVQSPHPADMSAALGWTHGEVVAHDWPLSRLLATMNRYSTIKLQLADPSLEDMRVSGTFRAGNQQTLVKILHAGWQLRATKASPDKILLYRE